MGNTFVASLRCFNLHQVPSDNSRIDDFMVRKYYKLVASRIGWEMLLSKMFLFINKIELLCG